METKIYGLRSAEGIVTIAPSLEHAVAWLDYEFPHTIGHVGEVLVEKCHGHWVDKHLETA